MQQECRQWLNDVQWVWKLVTAVSPRKVRSPPPATETPVVQIINYLPKMTLTQKMSHCIYTIIIFHSSKINTVLQYFLTLQVQ